MYAAAEDTDEPRLSILNDDRNAAIFPFLSLGGVPLSSHS
jgi:hypothetical protein